MKMKRPLRAVIIDDDPVELSYLRHILQRRGYEVQSYESPIKSPLYQGKKCPCSLDARCPDLIITDYSMPDVNGVELLEMSTKKGCHCRHLALIAGKGLLEGDLLRVAKFGTRYFLKPIDLDDFYPWLDRVEQDIDHRFSDPLLPGITPHQPTHHQNEHHYQDSMSPV